MRSHTLSTALVVVLLGLAIDTTSVRAAQPDAWITTKVKIAILTASGVDGFPIAVDTYDGAVTLYGKVRTPAERGEAERAASGVGGVHHVRNLIAVVPTQERVRVGAADSRILREVVRALNDDPELRDSHIMPRSVDRGVVLLAGRAQTLSDQLRALQDAADVPGVRRVASEIESPSQFGDRDVWYDESTSDWRNGARAQDAWITARTKLHYFTDTRIPSNDISVDTHHRVVTLFGTAPSVPVRRRAEEVARSVHGVTDVRNELRIVPRSRHDMAIAGDEDLTRSIRDRIAGAGLAGAEVHVDVRAGVARLTGTVRSGMDRYSVVALARSTDGVRGVNDDLRVESARTSMR